MAEEILETPHQYQNLIKEIDRLKRINNQIRRRLKDRGSQFRCNWCGSISRSKKMTIHWNERTGEILFLCFRGCQHFPEPFQDTQAGGEGGSQQAGWHRIDPWQDYKRPQPRLRKEHTQRNYIIADAPTRQLKIGEV